jgi:hypothetical protein
MAISLAKSIQHLRSSIEHGEEEILLCQPNVRHFCRQRASAPLRYIDPSIHFTTAQRAPAAHNVDCVTLESLVGDVSE